MQDFQLWDRIKACHPDDVEADFPFSVRLARDNCWSRDFAARVVIEYQRFAYLSRLQAGMVTPSDEVDQAWHLHLTYTRHYWGPFKQALGGALHHMPTKGGPDQADLFRQAYAKTLDLYRKEFGEPPEDIWPPAEIRFGKAPHFRRVNTRDVWLVPKPKWPAVAVRSVRRLKSVPASATALLLAALSLLIGTSLAFAHGQAEGDTLFEKLQNMIWHWATQHTINFLIGIAVIGFVLYSFFNKASGGGSSGCGSSCGSDGASGCGSGCGGCGGD